MRRRDENRATGVSSLSDEEPPVVMKMCIDVVREVVRKDHGDSCGCVVGKGKAPLCRGRCGSVHERSLGVENRDISCYRGGGVHRGSKVLTAGRGDEDVVGVDGDVFVKRGKKESVEEFLGDLGGSGRHR